MEQEDHTIPVKTSKQILYYSSLQIAREVLKKQGTIKSDSEMRTSIDEFETKLVEEIS